MKAYRKNRIIPLIGSVGLVFLLLGLFVSFFHPIQEVASAQSGTDGPPPGPSLEMDGSAFSSPYGVDSNPQGKQSLVSKPGKPFFLDSPLACGAPLVMSGSIITGTNPQYSGRLIRNGLPSTCGEAYTCSGIQSTSTPFSYEEFSFINPTSDWQCVDVKMDSRSCAQQVYSAAYINSFNPGNLCQNIEGAMGFSTSGVYGYSLNIPPGTDFKIVNNTTGIVPPSSDCADYTMTVTLCSSTPQITATKGVGPQVFYANSTGDAVLQVPVVFKNLGDFTGSVNASTISETVNISVQDGQPAAVNAAFGTAGAIVQPGETITQTIPLAFSGSQYQCLPRLYSVDSALAMTYGIYHCNGYNPPSTDVRSGSVLPDDNFDEDSYAFQSKVGTQITVTVDTVSAATAFDIEACISGEPNGDCLPGLQGDDNFSCTFPPPSFACPRFGGLLPTDPDGDDIYYVRINSGSGAGNFAGPIGDYRATILVTAGPTGACSMVAVLDNGQNSFLATDELLALSANSVPSTTVQAAVEPIWIQVPPSDPTNPSCAKISLPIVTH
jgi:hypothetical protein